MGVQVGDVVMVSVAQLQEIPPKNLILLAGPPGSGKSAFCQQSVLQNLASDRPIIYVTTKGSSSDTEKALRERGLGKIEPGSLFFIDAYNETVGLMVSKRLDTIQADSANLSSISIAITKLQERIGKKGILLVFDSLTSPYLLSGPEILRFMSLTLSRFVSEENGALACFDEGSGKPEDLTAMMSIADSVIKIQIEKDKQLLKVVKHSKIRPTRIEIPIESERLGIVKRIFDVNMLKQVYQAWECEEMKHFARALQLGR